MLDNLFGNSDGEFQQNIWTFNKFFKFFCFALNNFTNILVAIP